MVDSPAEGGPDSEIEPGADSANLADSGVRWRWVGGLPTLGDGAAVLAFFAYFAAIQLALPDFAGVDAYHHTKVGALFFGVEETAPTFRWTAESTWNGEHADKDWLLHVYLGGWVRAVEALRGPLAPDARPDQAMMLAGKLAAALLAGLLLGLVRRMLIAQRIPGATWWCLLLVLGMPSFASRLALVRPHILGVGMCLACLHAYWRERWLTLAALAVVYPLAYTASHTLLALVVLLTAGRLATGRSWPIAPLWIAPLGLLAGFCVHPHFPLILELWVDQNITALFRAIGGVDTGAMRMPAEHGPFETDMLIREDQALIGVWLVAVGLWLQARRPASDETQDVFLLAAAFGGLMLLASRFIEYAGPFALLFGALTWRDVVLEGGAGPAWWGRVRRLAWPLLIVLVLPFGVARTIGGSRLNTGAAAAYRDVALHVAERSAKDERVFHTAWGLYPGLFFYNHHNTYIVGLDPHFMYVRSPERWQLWRTISDGRHADPVGAIRETFDARWVILDSRDSAALQRQLDAAPAAERVREAEIPAAGIRRARWLRVYRLDEPASGAGGR